MPYARPQSDGGDGSLVVYPIDHMREIAAKILIQAGEFQGQHELTWTAIQNFLYDELDKRWQPILLECLQPYAERLKASFDWQIDLASALYDAADAIEGTDTSTAQSFVPRHGPQQLP